jgi:hypothetical protein
MFAGQNEADGGTVRRGPLLLMLPVLGQGEALLSGAEVASDFFERDRNLAGPRA